MRLQCVLHGLSEQLHDLFTQLQQSIPICRPFIEIIVKSPNRNLLAFVDTGADATLLPLDTLKSIKAERRDRLQMRDVLGRVASVDLYLATIVIGDYQITGIQAIALPIGSEPIIGRDVLNQLIVTLNGLAGVVEISD